MSLSFELTAETRTDMGKGASRRLRRDGKVPAILYGGDAEPQALTLSHNELWHNLEHEAFFSHILTIKVDGQPQQAVLRDLQRHPAKALILHVDLQRVNETDKIHVRVPLHVIGEESCPGIKAGGLLTHDLTEADVTCLAKDLPEFIEVDVSAMNVGDALHLSDLKLPEGMQFTELLKGDEHDLAVVSIHAKKGGAEETETGEEEGGSEE
ncbi:50S ribosomal protein L25/general stress protein Ctc [Thiohalobacter sp. IOR34]|uniref:50S ribosomal protein L25/general stress protein Ctc n=1 Tax=Thiohalobacter sp. IOR34 TaxID=3057176 RepID=UPI0025B0AB94|nr:50S ribosomal protein L25/general stress protein Ctc [Thiohalobacter sp. IOR34]WJW75949.1 50S ribosomal protein L25/general stress protein Ctc [Thiohalobacter sp. IOR34]